MHGHPLTVMLGKLGDILTLLPILKRESESGIKPALMVSKDYIGLLEGVSYVEPVVFNGGTHEIQRALGEAEKLSDKVRMVQVCGPMAEVRRCVLNRNKDTEQTGKMMGDSFQKSIWHLAGYWGNFTDGWPLVFDRRSPEREQALIEKHLFVDDRATGQTRRMTKRKICLVSTGRHPGRAEDGTQFQYKDLLWLILNYVLKRWHVVDLDEVVAERFQDLLGLYEKAQMLIATDNGPLHLAYAVKNLAVCALIADKPVLWNGSAWRPNHVFHCRYSDFPQRVHEMVDVLERGLDHGTLLLERLSEGPKKLHVWSQYEITPQNKQLHGQASATWRGRYQSERGWITCPIEVGAVGRDSENNNLQGGRYPYLKDVLRVVKQRAAGADTVVVTRSDTCFNGGQLPHGYAHRVIKAKDGPMHSPWIDYISFPARELSRIPELPDLVMGPDPHWSNVLAKWSRVPEIEDVTWREDTLVYV